MQLDKINPIQRWRKKLKTILALFLLQKLSADFVEKKIKEVTEVHVIPPLLNFATLLLWLDKGF